MISDNISHQGRKTKVTRVFGGRLTFKLPSLTKVSNSSEAAVGGARTGGYWIRCDVKWGVQFYEVKVLSQK